MRWALLLVAGVLLGAHAAPADVLREASELRRRMQYEAAQQRLQQALPDLQGESRAQALLLLAESTSDAHDARRLLLDATKIASATPETERRVALELARLDFARGNYRSAEARLAAYAADPQAALLRGLTAVALGETASLRSILEPANRSELAQILVAWGDLQQGEAETALAALQPLAGRRQGDFLPTVLLWKTQCETALGLRDRATETSGDLRERFPATPEADLVRAVLAADAGQSAPTRSEPPAESRLDFALQVGSFEDRANALRLRESLGREFRPVVIEELRGEKQRVYRVLLGAFESHEAAETFANERLAPRGLSWQVVQSRGESHP